MMHQTTKLFKTLIKKTNIDDPSRIQHFFKHLLSSSPQISESHYNFIPIVTQILIRAKLLPEIDQLHSLLETSFLPLIALIQTSANFGLLDKALSQFKSLRKHFPTQPPPVHVYNILMRKCMSGDRVEMVSEIYRDMLVSKLLPETYTINLLISLFCDLGRLEDAQVLFDKMPIKGCLPNESSFGILINGYCKAGLGLQALEVFKKMGSLGVSRKVVEASRIFEDMQGSCNEELGLPRPNLITFNQMLEGFFKEGMLDKAENCINCMKRDGAFTKLESYNIWLVGLVRNKMLAEARLVLEEMNEKGITPSIYSYNIVLDGLCKEGMFSDARFVMEYMRINGTSPDTVTYTTLLHGYCCKGKVFEANTILQEMISNGCFPNTFTCNILLQSLWKEEKISEAEKLLQKMNERGYGLDIVTCNIVIRGLCKSGKLDKAIMILDGMWIHGSAALGDLGNSFIGLVDNTNNRKKCLPDLVTYSTVIDGLCKAGRLDEAKKIRENERCNIALGYNGAELRIPYGFFFCLLIRAFFKSCDFEAAKETFEIALSICGHKEGLYRLMLNELLVRGKVSEANELFLVIMDRGFDVRGYTYKNLIEGLCKEEMLDEACKLLRKMLGKTHGFDPSSFISVIDALGKSGNKHEANEFSERMMEMASDVTEEKKRNGEVYDGKELDHRKQQKDGFRGTEWRNISHRDDGSGVALKVIRRVQKGWGHGRMSSLQPQKNAIPDYWGDT
ncbi:hypothetical protein GIB67_036619 [Kingdonia uniflora]|uniref:Pentatricopeptide repeat-containing protein n=1 Tax=Kingdonia uniflora TaxID=39325 RepID=A0A7J7M0S4_9MAGN|nr:hypothetical protein GIB67_036619 [Kingdonia uniflora]